MKLLFITLWLIGISIYAWAETETVPMRHRDDRYGETAVEMSDGLPFVMGKIKGHRVGYFLVDLGASHTIVQRSVLGEKEKSEISSLSSQDIPEITGLQGKIKSISGQITLEYFKTGTINLKKIPVLVVDTLYELGGKKVLGILGLDILGRAPCLRFTMSHGRKAKFKMMMSDCDDDISVGSLSDSLIIQNDFVIIPGMVNGHRTYFILDTGSKHTFITPGIARQCDVIWDSNSILVYTGLDLSPDTAITGHAANINLGQTRVERVGLYIGNIPEVKGESYSTGGIIGMDIINRFQTLEINFRQRQFIVLP